MRSRAEIQDELNSVLNKIEAMGYGLEGNRKVQVIFGTHSAFYLKNEKIILKFRRPDKQIKCIEDILPLICCRSEECNSEELNILIDWFANPCNTLRWINYEMMMGLLFDELKLVTAQDKCLKN